MPRQKDDLHLMMIVISFGTHHQWVTRRKLSTTVTKWKSLLNTPPEVDKSNFITDQKSRPSPSSSEIKTSLFDRPTDRPSSWPISYNDSHFTDNFFLANSSFPNTLIGPCLLATRLLTRTPRITPLMSICHANSNKFHEWWLWARYLTRVGVLKTRKNSKH